MKYFFDTEFHEYKKKPLFGKPIDTIELISIGIISEDIYIGGMDLDNTITPKGKEYYSICKDFDLKVAWNNEWLRENVLYPIHIELSSIDGRTEIHGSFKDFKRLINKYGKTRKKIAEEIKECVNYKKKPEFGKGLTSGNHLEVAFGVLPDYSKPEFYAYYADYDHVCLSWLYGRMVDLPTGFPQYTKDIQQMIDDNNINKELLLKEVPQINCHNSLQDAIWNKKAYNWIAKQLQ